MRILLDTNEGELEFIIEAISAHREKALKHIDSMAEKKLQLIYERYKSKVQFGCLLQDKITDILNNERNGI